MLTPVIVGPQFSCRLDQAPPPLLPPSLANKRFTTSDITTHNTDTINTKGIITTSVDTRNCEPLGKKKEPRDWGGGYFWVFIMAADQIRGERCQIRRSPFSASGDSAGCHLGTKVLLPPIFFFAFSLRPTGQPDEVLGYNRKIWTHTYNLELAIDVPTRFRMKNYFDITTVECRLKEV